MKVTYHSKMVRTTDQFFRLTFGPDRIHTTVISPRTGKKYGMVVEDNCGEIAVYGPTFAWPAIRSIIRKSQGYLDPIAMARAQQNINDRYCGIEC